MKLPSVAVVLCLLAASLSGGAQEADAGLGDLRALRLKGELEAARTLALTHIESGPIDQRPEWRLELARVFDRIGLHQNTRPVNEAIDQIELAAAEADPNDDRLRAAIELARADYHYRAEMSQRVFPTATQHANNAVRLYNRLDDRHGEAEAVHKLGLIALQQRRLVEARQLFDRSLELDSEGGQRVFFQGEYERHVAFVYLFSEDNEAAIPYLERSLESRKRAGAIDAAMFAAGTLAAALVRAHRVAEAEAPLHYGLELVNQLGSPVAEAQLRLTEGRWYAAKGQTNQAARAFRRAVEVADSVNYQSLAAQARAALSPE